MLPGFSDDHSVAIIMRTKDRPGFLDRAVQDVLAQTWADWQLVVVNDGGNADQVSAVLDRYRTQLGERLTLVNNPVSHGMEAASNLGLEQSSSEFVVVHDDDDTWQPRFLHETVDHLRSHTEDLAVATRTDIVLERQVANDWVTYDHFPMWPELHGQRLIDFIKINRIVPICLLYRRSVHETLGDFAEDYPVIGDYVFHLRLLQSGNIGFIDEQLANWHRRPETSDATSSNSMYAAAGDHAEYDLMMRDRALKEWTTKNGLGLPLFISKELEREADRLDHHLSQLTVAGDQSSDPRQGHLSSRQEGLWRRPRICEPSKESRNRQLELGAERRRPCKQQAGRHTQNHQPEPLGPHTEPAVLTRFGPHTAPDHHHESSHSCHQPLGPDDCQGDGKHGPVGTGALGVRLEGPGQNLANCLAGDQRRHQIDTSNEHRTGCPEPTAPQVTQQPDHSQRNEHDEPAWATGQSAGKQRDLVRRRVHDG